MKSLLKAVKVLTGIVITLAVLFGILVSCARSPSDAGVREKFASVKPTLEELRVMLEHEPVTIIGVTDEKVILDGPALWVSSAEAKMPEEHFAQYQELLKKAGMKWVRRLDDGISFAYQGWGFAGSGWRLIFLYSSKAPSPLISSLDAPVSNDSVEHEWHYRPLDVNWYAVWVY